MTDKRRPLTNNPQELEWDNAGEQEWTYFSNAVKRRVSYFLNTRLSGRNLDIGGGWHLLYPNSTVVDLSSVCLEHNPAKEKLQFDLEELSRGKKLPYADNSFDSATMVSSWQYLSDPVPLINELKRVLKSRAELYVINGQGAGKEGCIKGASTSQEVEKILKAQGLDTLIEVIPFGNPAKGRYEFQSVCTAMPGSDLVEKNVSRIENKQTRIEQDKYIRENPRSFQEDYADYIMVKARKKLAELSEFPVTAYSVKYLENVEGYSREYFDLTGQIPLIFAEHASEPEIGMIISEENRLFFPNQVVLEGKDKKNSREIKDLEESLSDKYEVSYVGYIGYFGSLGKSREEIIENCKSSLKSNDPKAIKMIMNKSSEFLAFTPLNSFTKEFQGEMYSELKSFLPELDRKIERRRSVRPYWMITENKNNLEINNLISLKQKLERDDVPIIERRIWEFEKFLPYIRERILEEDQPVYCEVDYD